MEPHEDIVQPGTTENDGNRRTALKIGANTLIVASLLVIVYFSYAFISRASTVGSSDAAQPAPLKLIQLDVLNGCRINGAAGKVTRSLRANGFDVVEMKNYKMSNIRQ